MSACAENTHHRGKYHCMADLLFDWNKLNCCSLNISKVAESKHNKQEVNHTVILPLN